MGLEGFILAGGRSSRMGTDKSLLRFGESTLIELALSRMRLLTSCVSIVSPRDDLAKYAPVVHDIYPDRGPLGGIHAALASCTHGLALMLAVDMPLVPVEVLERLVAAARESETVVTVPQTNDGLQPLCAVYRKEFAILAERALQGDDYKIDRLFKQTETLTVDETELEKWGYNSQIFMNLNTPDDLRKIMPSLSSKSKA